jgi:hypothetical protein
MLDKNEASVQAGGQILPNKNNRKGNNTYKQHDRSHPTSRCNLNVLCKGAFLNHCHHLIVAGIGTPTDTEVLGPARIDLSA